MTKTKTTPRRGSSSHRQTGIMTARFTGAEKEAEQQFADAPGKDTEDSQEWPDVEEGTSKSTGKAGDQPQQAEGGAEAPPEELPTPPSGPQPSTSKNPTDTPAAVPAQDPTVAKPDEVEEETPPELTAYVKSYKQAGETWLDTVLDKKEQAYIILHDRLSKKGRKQGKFRSSS